ncbi:hypothetical protein BC832DRAFT_478558 [Gaertneriomyces semiglobifer]|nr:hypothetical protein BC832DRAFT_478558 [Gaertneriomyces semiglobifer]
MIGVEVARTQNDVKEMLVCCVRCWEVMQPVLHSNGRDCCDILPQLRLNKRRPSTASANFITYLLTKCFDTFVQCYAALQPSDRAKAVHNYFAAVALHLVQHLLARGDKQRGQKVAEAALLLIRKVIDEDMVDAVGDSRLNDKAHIGTGKKKDLLLSHVVYHAWKSCTSDPTFGYDVCFDPRRRDNAYLTAVCDALDVEVFRITVQPIKQLQPAASTASLSAAPSTAALLRVRGNTPIVSLLTLLVQSPASAIDQLHASRTAKEYARLAACVASEGMLIAPEAIVKLCAEVEEWLVSRNLGILCFEEGTKDRNRKRKDLFKETSGQGGFDDLRGRSKKRGRKPSLAHTGGPVNSFAAKGHRNDDSVKRFTDNINEESDDADIDSPSSPPGRRISRSPERSPGRLNGPPFRKQSISPRRQKSASKQRSSSPQEQPESTAQRRKQRQALLSSFPADVRERVDQAARVLDSTLVGMWRRRRYARRARAIVAYEGESRARLAFSRGIAAWVMTERDIGVRPSVQPDRLHVLDPAFFCAVGTFHTSLTPTQRATLLSALQSLTQSVVHASRAEAYPLLVNFATVFAEVYRRGILNGHFAKNDVEKGLWKAWRVVADCVIHMLNKLELEQEESDIGASFSTARWLDRNGMPHTMHLPLHAIALFLQQTQAVLYVARKIRLMEYFLAQSLPTLDLVAPLHGAHVLHSTYLHEPSAAGLLNVIRSYEQLHHNFPTTARPRATFVAWTLMSHALLLLGVGDRPSASLFFAKALDALLNQDDVASKWISRQVTAESILMQAGAAGNTVLAAVAATMLSSIRYQERNYAVRDSLTVLASILFSAPLTTTFVHPKEPVSHATYTPQYLAPREYIFMRELPITLTSLSYVMERLLHLQRFTESVRVASVAEYAGTSCGDLLTVGKGRLVKAIALAAMGHILPALRALCAVVQGDILVGLDEQVVCNQTQRATLDSPKVTEAAVVIPFLNDLAIDPQLQELFSDTLLLEFALCKADVILTVASQQEYYIEPTAIGHLSIAYEGLRQSMQGSHEKMGPEHSYRAYRCLARLEEMRGHLAVSLRAFAALSDWDSVLIDFPEFLLKRGIFSQAFHFATKAQKAARDVNSPMETRLRTIALESALHAHWSGLMVRHPDDWTKEQAKLHDYLRALDENQLRLFGVTVDVAHAWERLGDALLCLDPTSEKMAKAHYTKALSLLQPARNGHHIARISYKRYQVDHDLAAMKQATAHLDFSKVSLPVLIPMLTSIGDFEGASNALNTFIQAAHFDVQFFGEATIMLLDVACARGDAQISEGVLASWTYSGALCKKLWDECIAEQAVARVGKRNPTSKDKKPKPVSLPEAVHRQIDFGYFALTEAGGISIDEWIRNALTSPEDVFASNLEFSQEATGADIATAVKFLADLYKKQSRLDSMFTGQLAQLLAVWFRSRPGSSGIPLLATLTKDGSPMPGDTAVLVRRGERMILLHTASKPVAKKSQGRQQPTTPSTPAKGHGRTSTTGDSASQPLPELVWHAVEVMPDVYSDVHQTLTRVHQLLHSHEVDGDEIDDLWWKSTEAIKRSVLGTSVEEDTERPKPTTEIVELALKCFGDPGAIVMESAPSAQGLFIGWMARLVALKQRKIKPRVSFSL